MSGASQGHEEAVERRWARIEQGREKARLTWAYAFGPQIILHRRDLRSPLYQLLVDAGIPHSHIGEGSGADFADHEGWMVLDSRAKLDRAARAIGGWAGVPAAAIARSILLQDIVYGVVERGLIDRPFSRITLGDVRGFVAAEPPVSALEFDAIFRGGFYGDMGFDAILAVAGAVAPRRLSPMPRRPRGSRRRLSAPVGAAGVSQGERRWHWSSPAASAAPESLGAARARLAEEHLQKDESGSVAVDPVSMQPIPKGAAVRLDRAWYNRRTLREWIQHGNDTVPHSRRRLTPAERLRILS